MQQRNNNNIFKEKTTFSISKSDPFGSGNVIIDAVAEALKIKGNMQKQNDNIALIFILLQLFSTPTIKRGIIIIQTKLYIFFYFKATPL